MLTKVRMINFLDGWVNKAKRLGDGNDSNKSKSTKKEKERERERQTDREEKRHRERKRREEEKERTTIGSQDEYDVILQVTIFLFSLSARFFFSWLIVLLSHLTVE